MPADYDEGLVQLYIIDTEWIKIADREYELNKARTLK